MHSLSVSEMIRFGWETFKKRPGFFIGAGVTYIVISAIINQIGSQFDARAATAAAPAIAYTASFLFGFLLNAILSIGLIGFILKAHDALEKASIKDLWHPRGYWSFAAVSILTGLAALVGFILLIVPGVIVSVMLMFAGYVVVDRGLTPIDAIKESYRITDGHKWDLLLLLLSVVLLNVVGAICLLVGLFVTMPVSMLALAHAYRTLSGHTHPHTSHS